MKTDLPTLLHDLKPDGHANCQLSTKLHRLAIEVQEMADNSYAAIIEVTAPEYKGDVVGELIPWPGHFPLELDHSSDYLNDICVRGASVSEHLAPELWERAEAYLQEHYGPEEYEVTKKQVQRMDAADLRAERAA